MLTPIAINLLHFGTSGNAIWTDCCKQPRSTLLLYLVACYYCYQLYAYGMMCAQVMHIHALSCVLALSTASPEEYPRCSISHLISSASGIYDGHSFRESAVDGVSTWTVAKNQRLYTAWRCNIIYTFI